MSHLEQGVGPGNVVEAKDSHEEERKSETSVPHLVSEVVTPSSEGPCYFSKHSSSSCLDSFLGEFLKLFVNGDEESIFNNHR